MVVVAKRNHISGNIRGLIYSRPWIFGSVGDYRTSPLPLAALLHRPALPEDDATSPAVIAHLLDSLATKIKEKGEGKKKKLQEFLIHFHIAPELGLGAGVHTAEGFFFLFFFFLSYAFPLCAVRAGLYTMFFCCCRVAL